jgi:hypothetical protein
MQENEAVEYEVIELEELEDISVPLHCNNSGSGE